MGPQGPPGVDGAVGPQGPIWARPFGYATYYYGPRGILQNLPAILTFATFVTQKMSYTSTRLIVQVAGFYQVTINIYSVYPLSANVWVLKNGLQFPDGSFYPPAAGTGRVFSATFVVAAAAGDYFEIRSQISQYIGYPNGIAYSLMLILPP
jgi:hypothetical protein